MGDITYIIGVSGCGKSTIGSLLSRQTGIPFFDGDDFHSAENIRKMKAGVPLEDTDRWDWLASINARAREEQLKKGAFIACSALKEKYRQILVSGIKNNCRWVLLEGEYETINKRLQERKEHFMPMSLLRTQFDSLEIPVYAIREDISKPAAEIVSDILNKLKS